MVVKTVFPLRISVCQPSHTGIFRGCARGEFQPRKRPMIETTLVALVALGMKMSSNMLKEDDVRSMALDVVAATPEPFLFPGERIFWLRTAWEEGAFQTSPKGHNDNGNACGVTQVNQFVIPAGMGTCKDLRSSRVKSIEASRAILKPLIEKCGGVRAAIGAYMTGGKCGSAPKLTARRCRDEAC